MARDNFTHRFLRTLAGIETMDQLTIMKGAFAKIHADYGEPNMIYNNGLDYVFTYGDFVVTMIYDPEYATNGFDYIITRFVPIPA